MTDSKTQHTPGPWKVAYMDIAGQAIVMGEHTEICTCWHHSVAAIEQEMNANARLIAASPDLLGCVKDFARVFEQEAQHYERVAGVEEIAVAFRRRAESARSLIAQIEDTAK